MTGLLFTDASQVPVLIFVQKELLVESLFTKHNDGHEPVEVCEIFLLGDGEKTSYMYKLADHVSIGYTSSFCSSTTKQLIKLCIIQMKVTV